MADESTATDTNMPSARRPTPSHDAAQVLVSFHQNGAPTEADDARRRSRPLALANLHRPPQNRRRVWRACEACRKKKIKCDGADPCQCCVDSGRGQECLYAGDGSRRGFVDAQVLDLYGKRLRALEDLVTTLVDDQQRLATQLVLQKQDVVRDQPLAMSFAPDMPLSRPENLCEPQNLALPVPSDSSTDTIDPELVSGEPQTEPIELPNATVGAMLDAAHGSEDTTSRVYTDDYGILAADGHDGAKYVGLGATVWMMDDCPGIRGCVRQGLLQKGHAPQETLLEAPGSILPKTESSPVDRSDPLPPVALMDALIDAFFRHVYRLFPIIEAEDFRRQYLRLRSHQGPRAGFDELLYAVLAVASTHLTADDPVWGRPGCSAYRCLDLGDHFSSLAVAAVGAHDQPAPWAAVGPSINTVTALTLLAMHRTRLGQVNDAWRMVGHAVRLGYEMGLHRSPKRMGLPLLDIKRRCQLWWCLYVMDRLLALHLGRPLAIHDDDSDVFFPSARPQAPGFVAMTHLCQLIGQIHGAVNRVTAVRRWQDAPDTALQTQFDQLWRDLQAWRTTNLPDTSRVADHCVLLSTYCSAVHLLFRTHMATPHRTARLTPALDESFRAAVECIDLSEAFLRAVPHCHYTALHGLNVVASVATLLHCRRQTDEDRVAADARHHARRGVAVLAGLQPVWPPAASYKDILAQYEELTSEVVNHGRCICSAACPPPKAQPAIDPWQEFATQVDLEANLFPSMPDTAWMNELFHLSPDCPPDMGECSGGAVEGATEGVSGVPGGVPVEEVTRETAETADAVPGSTGDTPRESERPSKRRKTAGASVCTFAFKQR